MLRLITFLFIIFLCRNNLFAQSTVNTSYKNAKLSTELRVKDLLKRMTLEEKVAQMQCIWSGGKRKMFNEKGEFDETLAAKSFPHGLGQVGRPNEGFGEEYITSKNLNPRETAERSNRIQKYFIEKSRLGIPVMFHEESLHGNQAIGATNFPSHLALGSTWDEALLTEIYTAVAEEVRVRGAHQVLAPVVDLGRDPRWGRTEETLGEDPYHVSRMAVAEVKAYQGNSGTKIDKKHVAATLKHLGVHGAPEGGSNAGPAFYDERTIRETFLPSFKACVQQGKVLSIMPCYNELSGIPAHTNTWLLHDLVRKEWGFKGYYTSDYYGIQELITVHKMVKDSAEAAIMALNAGVDIETPNLYAYNALPALVKKGRIKVEKIDEIVTRILTVKFDLGLFDDPYTDPERAEKIIGSDKNRAIALKAAQEAMILLKNNNNLLPLNPARFKKVAVIGPNADRCILGGYSSEPRQKITPLQGLKSKANQFEIVYSEGCRISDKGDWFSDSVILSKPAENRARIQKAVEVAKASDIILLFVGGNETTSREGWSPTHLGDLSDLELIGEQNELISALKTLNKPIAAFIFSGQPLAFQHLDSSAQAIVNCFYLGQETGNAVADLILGNINPSGKLSVSVPRSAGHLPCYYNYKPSARRGYLFEDIKPLYPFGHGLSYTTFTYSKPEVDKAKIRQNESVTVTVKVANTGQVAGSEVVQLYIRDVHCSITRPVKELKDFKRITLAPGETRTVQFTVSSEKLKFYNRDMKYVVEPGQFEIYVGTSSVENQKVSFEISE